MYLRSAVVATIDDPRYNGIVLPGDRGHRRSWRFDDPSHFAQSIGQEPSRKLTDEWSIESGQWTMRHYPALHCMAPAPDFARLKACTLWDGNDGEWEVQHDLPEEPNLSRLWKEVTPQAFPRLKWLWWYDGRGMYDATRAYKGRVVYQSSFLGSNMLYDDPSFLLQAYRFFPDPEFLATHYTYLEIRLRQTPDIGRILEWGIGIPGPSANNEKRSLYLGLKSGLEADNPAWEVVQRFESANPSVDSNGVLAERLQFEVIDGCFLLNLNGEEFVYRVPFEQTPDFGAPEGFDPPSLGQAVQSVEVYGHSAMFNFSRLDFPGDDATLTPQADLRYTYPLEPTVFNVSQATQNGTGSVWKPPGTAVQVTGEYEGSEAATGCELFRPRVRATSTVPWARAAIYVATVDWPPAIAAGTTTGQYTTEGADTLVSARGSVAEDWRQSTCDLSLEMDAADVAAVATWKGNNRVQVRAGWQTDTGPDTAVQFTGYLRQRAHALDSAKPGRVVIDLPCSDGFFRLEKKYWNDLGNWEGQTVSALFHRALNQGGVPDALISVGAGVADIRIRRAVFGGEPRFDFREDTSVPEGLNLLLSSVGCVWGVDQNGTWFVRAPSQYVDGQSSIAFILDEDEQAITSYLLAALRAETQFDELEDGRPFANYVLVKTERGGEEEFVEVWDYDNTSASQSLSHHVPGDPNFIGDDWWHVIVGGDLQSAWDLANRIIRDRAGDREGGRVANRRQTITFNADLKPGLFPGDYVQVKVTGVPAATDSIFQITQKDWSCSEGDRTFTAQYTARFVQ